jgi:Spy/CpxP family protein refolding chaperone
MRRLIRPLSTLCVVVLAASAAAPRASAQVAGFVKLFRPYHQTALAQLPEVEQDLKLTGEQKSKIVELYDKLNEDRQALFPKAQSDFEGFIADMTKLTNDAAKAVNALLDETQQKRLAEIYVQANGPIAAFDDAVATELKLTDDQKKKLIDVRNEQFGSFQGVDWQSMSEEEANKKIDEIIAEQNKAYAAVLTDEQRAALDKMQGEKLEIDLANLPNPFAPR